MISLKKNFTKAQKKNKDNDISNKSQIIEKKKDESNNTVKKDNIESISKETNNKLYNEKSIVISILKSSQNMSKI